MRDCLEDLRSPAHTKHALVQMVRQRVYQIAAGYEDCHDADFLRIDPALRLAIGKDHKVGASQSMLSRSENDVLGNAFGLAALDAALTRSTDALLRRKNKAAADYRLGFYPRTLCMASKRVWPTTVILARTAFTPCFALAVTEIVLGQS